MSILRLAYVREVVRKQAAMVMATMIAVKTCLPYQHAYTSSPYCTTIQNQGCTESTMIMHAHADVMDKVGCKERKEKTTPFGINLMRSPV